ncbi:MAG: hypothetical protein Q4G67_00530 [Actinomycetia bacterium]|nr:hypothetical protein [Actinomycetes bacterium]
MGELDPVRQPCQVLCADRQVLRLGVARQGEPVVAGHFVLGQVAERSVWSDDHPCDRLQVGQRGLASQPGLAPPAIRQEGNASTVIELEEQQAVSVDSVDLATAGVADIDPCHQLDAVLLGAR